MSASEPLGDSLRRHLVSSLGVPADRAEPSDVLSALSLAVKDRLLERWLHSQSRLEASGARRMYYLSLEFLIGRSLENALVNLGLEREARELLERRGLSYPELMGQELDASLGNGGLGRLAVCFLDSLATLGLPGEGYGLRYDYGIFRQELRDGRQIEWPDEWSGHGGHWTEAPARAGAVVRFGGRVIAEGHRRRWVEGTEVLARLHVVPIPGYGGRSVTTLRLFSAHSRQPFDLGRFNAGDHAQADPAEAITRVLYPVDTNEAGHVLRLKQQYFLVAASIDDALRRHLARFGSVDGFADKVVFQMNDTHPALAVAELVRVLVDDHGVLFERAFEMARGALAYTNHTLLPEALERWPVSLFERMLPRHFEIIRELDARLLDDIGRRFPGDAPRQARMSIFDDRGHVRMAHLAAAGSYSINGVAALHSALLKSLVLPDFAEVWPERFSNKTNGVTPRRWLKVANRPLAELVEAKLGGGIWSHLEGLSALAEHRGDEAFMGAFVRAKHEAKGRLIAALEREHGISVSAASIVDVQVKWIHEYKRQLLNVLHIVHLHQELRRRPDLLQSPRTFLIAGKAYPTYLRAKLIIKLISDVGRTINADRATRDWLRLHFIPNYRVSAAEYLIPGADVSEQISTAGYEASGTGNMKFAMNGAVTVGTLDGANIEIAERVGRENIFIFGLNVDEVQELRRRGYRPRDVYERDPNVREVIELLRSGYYNRDEPDLYKPLCDALLDEDFYLVLADFDAYRRAHREIDRAFADRERWRQMSLKNVASAGWFSSDRTIREYAKDIWRIEPVGG